LELEDSDIGHITKTSEWLSELSKSAPTGCTVATKLVRNDLPRSASTGLQQLAKEADSSQAVALRLHQNVNHGAVLINRTPEIMLDANDLQEHFIQEPLVAQLLASGLNCW
jgi:hypothetical protein